MEKLLQDMLNEVVVTPYDAAITKRLSTICDAYAEEVTIDNIDDYIVPFVMNKPDIGFKKKIETSYTEQYHEENPIVLPPLFTIVLSQYITIKVITENMDGKEQAIASLILMNYMLYRKGTFVRLILPNQISEMYYKMDEYIESLNIKDTDSSNKHLKGLLSDANYLKNHFQDIELAAEVRRMAKTTYLYQQQELIGRYKSEKETQPYVKVYNFLSTMVNQTDWLFIDNDVVKLLLAITGEDTQKKSSTIESVINELRKASVAIPYEKLEKSSLLLRYVAGKERIPDEIKNKRLTVMEFGVYVYYELLLEHIISDYYDNGK